jgi:hypothetical protein
MICRKGEVVSAIFLKEKAAAGSLAEGGEGDAKPPDALSRSREQRGRSRSHLCRSRGLPPVLARPVLGVCDGVQHVAGLPGSKD